jgi:hypothetical protein
MGIVQGHGILLPDVPKFQGLHGRQSEHTLYKHTYKIIDMPEEICETCLVTTNNEQRRVSWVEDTCLELVPAAVQLMHKFTVMSRSKRPYSDSIFTDRSKIVPGWVPTNWFNILRVTLHTRIKIPTQQSTSRIGQDTCKFFLLWDARSVYITKQITKC